MSQGNACGGNVPARGKEKDPTPLPGLQILCLIISRESYPCSRGEQIENPSSCIAVPGSSLRVRGAVGAGQPVDTAPKRRTSSQTPRTCWTTSQNGTAPKPLEQNPLCKGRTHRLALVTQRSIKSRSITLLLSRAYVALSVLLSRRSTGIFVKKTCSKNALKPFSVRKVLRFTNTMH